jgi:hypothetical protein
MGRFQQIRLSCAPGRNEHSIFLVFRWFVTRLSNLVDGDRLDAVTIFAVIADATGVGLLALLAQLSSHFHLPPRREEIVSKMRLPPATFAIPNRLPHQRIKICRLHVPSRYASVPLRVWSEPTTLTSMRNRAAPFRHSLLQRDQLVPRVLSQSGLPRIPRPSSMFRLG